MSDRTHHPPDDAGWDRAWACPNCKEAVSLQSEEVSNLASGYNWSVLFMLVVPFSMIGTGAFLVQRAPTWEPA